MTKYREILRLHGQGINNIGIASSCGCSRNTVASVLKHSRNAGLTWEDVRELTDVRISQLLFGERSDQANIRKMPDFQYVHKELSKSGVTLNLLWHEYCTECRSDGDIPFMYTQFCKYYRDFVITSKATMHIEHKPGEKLEVDWAGQTAYIADGTTGKQIPVYIFVATLPYSGYSYVEAFGDRKQDSWITAHVNAFNFFGGIARILVSDNLKTGIQKSSRYETIINRSYHEMAEHYGTCVIPARIKKPKDKPSVEKAVDIASMWILAVLRNQTFFTVAEMNSAIRELLTEFNTRPFQKKPGNRASVFAEERDFLLPMPRHQYELSAWKTSIVQNNYCVSVDRMFYSVPYEFIKKTVDVRVTKNIVEVFYNGSRICSHPRMSGCAGQYRIAPEHMPESHRMYADWDEEQCVSWAHSHGPNIAEVVEGWFKVNPVKQEVYRMCCSLFALGDKYSTLRLDDACSRALVYGRLPSLKTIRAILKSGYDKLDAKRQERFEDNSSKFAFTRGSSYYGGDSK